MGMEFHIRREVYEGMKEEGYRNEMEYCAHERESLTSELVRCVMGGNSIPGSMV